MTLKKKKGSVGQLILLSLSLFLMLFGSIAILRYLKPIVSKLEANKIARKYVLKVESKGYLTPSDNDALIAEFTAAGFTNINTAGSSTTKVVNGDDVFLQVSYTFTYKTYSIVNGMPKLVDETVSKVLQRSSTSKS